MLRRNFLQRVTAGSAILAGVGPASARTRGREDSTFALEPIGTRSANVRNEVSATYRDGELVLVGSLAGPDGCVDARAGTVEFEEDVPVITVERTSSGSVCTQALTAVEYRGTLSGLETRPRSIDIRYVDAESGDQFWRDRTRVELRGRSRQRNQPQVDDTSFSEVGTESGTRNTAVMSVPESDVVVDGWIFPDGTCHTPVLGDVSFDGQKLTVEVETVLQDGSEVCVSQLRTYNYELSVETSSIPDLVEVRHDGDTVLLDVPDRRFEG